MPADLSLAITPSMKARLFSASSAARVVILRPGRIITAAAVTVDVGGIVLTVGERLTPATAVYVLRLLKPLIIELINS